MFGSRLLRSGRRGQESDSAETMTSLCSKFFRFWSGSELCAVTRVRAGQWGVLQGIPMSQVFVVCCTLVVFTTFFNVALHLNELHCLPRRSAAIIASAPKLSPATALVSRYTSTPFTSASPCCPSRPVPGYVSVSVARLPNGACSPLLPPGLLP